MFSTVAITGSSGFIGRALTSYFLNSDKYVRGLDVQDCIYSPKLNTYSFARINLGDQQNLNSLNFGGTQGLIHLAAASGVVVDASVEAAMTEYNLRLTDNALAFCHDNQIPCMINASSSCVYGSQSVPFLEDMETRPISVYGESKARCEELLETKAQAMGVRVFSLRLFNIIGIFQRPDHLPWLAMDAMHGYRQPIQLYGISFRAYTWVEDLARCCSYILANYQKWPPGHYIFNFGAKLSLSQIKLFTELENIMGGLVVPYSIGHRRPNEMESTAPCMKKTERDLGNFLTPDGLQKGLLEVAQTWIHKRRS